MIDLGVILATKESDVESFIEDDDHECEFNVACDTVVMDQLGHGWATGDSLSLILLDLSLLLLSKAVLSLTRSWLLP